MNPLRIDPRLRAQMRSLVAELDPEDGQPNPRKSSPPPNHHYADSRLCAEVFRVLMLALAEPGAMPPGGADVLEVKPALTPDVAAAVERLRRVDDVAHVALMPDVHLCQDVCIGTVLGTHGRLYPAAIGGDVGCGVATVAFDGDGDGGQRPNDAAARQVLADLTHLMPTRTHKHDTPLPDDLEDMPLSSRALSTLRRRTGRREFGTLGRGNHFAEVQIELHGDTPGRIWAMVHSGSRALGPAIQTAHRDGPGLSSTDAESEAGLAYLTDLDFAITYAQASRRHMLQVMAVVLEERLGLQMRPETYLDCGHNHVRRETHGGTALWVHRKGAIPAADGEPGLIPGSMGDETCHVVGKGHPEALGSASHGAGRRLSRTEARGRIGERELHRQMRGVIFNEALAAALREEAPGVYRPLDAVLRAERDLVGVVRRLRPRISYKGT